MCAETVNQNIIYSVVYTSYYPMLMSSAPIYFRSKDAALDYVDEESKLDPAVYNGAADFKISELECQEDSKIIFYDTVFSLKEEARNWKEKALSNEWHRISYLQNANTKLLKLLKPLGEKKENEPHTVDEFILSYIPDAKSQDWYTDVVIAACAYAHHHTSCANKELIKVSDQLDKTTSLLKWVLTRCTIGLYPEVHQEINVLLTELNKK